MFGKDELQQLRAFLPLQLRKVQQEVEQKELRLEIIRKEID
jgi:hypothetical protein